MAEEMGTWPADILPLAAPLTEYLHTRYLRFFLEQDVVGHMESELDTPESELGQVPVTLCFIDLTGFTRYTEEEGDLEALDVVENFVETVEATLPPRGDDREDDRRRGDGRLARRRLADRVGGRVPAPASRSGRSRGSGSTAATPSTATATTSAPTSTSPTGSSAAPSPARCWSPTAWPRRSPAASGLDAGADRRGHPRRASPSRPRSSLVPSHAAASLRIGRRLMLEEVSSDAALLDPAGSRGRGDALRRPRLGLPARPGGAGCSERRGHARCTSTTACATTPTRTRRTARRSASGSGCGSRSSAPAARGPRQPAGLGPRRSLRGRGAAGAEARGDDRHRPHRRRPGRDDPLPARLLAEPPRAAGDAPAGRQPGAAAARLHPGGDHRLLRGRAASPGARTRPTPTRPSPATASATGCCRRWRRSTRPPRATSCARRSCCATRRRCSTPSSTPSSTADGGAHAARSRSQRLAELPPALRRLVVQRLADALPPGGPCPVPPATPTRWRRCAAPASRCSTSAAASARSSSAACCGRSVNRLGRSRRGPTKRPTRVSLDPPRLRRAMTRARDRRDPRRQRGSAAARRRAGAADQPGLRRPRPGSWSGC